MVLLSRTMGVALVAWLKMVGFAEKIDRAGLFAKKKGFAGMDLLIRLRSSAMMVQLEAMMVVLTAWSLAGGSATGIFHFKPPNAEE